MFPWGEERLQKRVGRSNQGRGRQIRSMWWPCKVREESVLGRRELSALPDAAESEEDED